MHGYSRSALAVFADLCRDDVRLLPPQQLQSTRMSSSDVTTSKSYSLHRPADVGHLRKADEDIRDANEDEVGGWWGLLMSGPGRHCCQPERKGVKKDGPAGRPASPSRCTSPTAAAAAASVHWLTDAAATRPPTHCRFRLRRRAKGPRPSVDRRRLDEGETETGPAEAGGGDRSARLLVVATLIAWRATRPNDDDEPICCSAGRSL